MKKPELLAPAGNLEKLEYAIAYGADAVYIGSFEYSLRAAADNFNLSQVKEAVKIAHRNDKNIYLALNIFAFNDDIKNLVRYLKELKKIKLDALIVSDPGILKLAMENAPEIPIHLSVQSNVMNIQAAKFWQSLKIKRLTLARELSLDDVKVITQNVDIETEIFIHGAMCIAYSGRCLISNYFTGRNANRGDCAQSCRWKYYLLEEMRPGIFCKVEETDEGIYLFNSKDLCLIRRIPELIKSGIDSFKIEGRNKSLHYLTTAVGTYRRFIDNFFNNKDKVEVRPEFIEELEKINRRGYTEGFIAKDGAMEDFKKRAISQSVEFIGLADQNADDVINVRNCFKKGDFIEVFWPTGELELLRVEKIQLVDTGKEINTANPNMNVRLNDKVFPKWSILRKRIVK